VISGCHCAEGSPGCQADETTQRGLAEPNPERTASERASRPLVLAGRDVQARRLVNAAKSEYLDRDAYK
jgi:hypothetical protein